MLDKALMHLQSETLQYFPVPCFAFRDSCFCETRFWKETRVPPCQSKIPACQPTQRCQSCFSSEECLPTTWWFELLKFQCLPMAQHSLHDPQILIHRNFFLDTKNRAHGQRHDWAAFCSSLSGEPLLSWEEQFRCPTPKTNASAHRVQPLQWMAARHSSQPGSGRAQFLKIQVLLTASFACPIEAWQQL